MPYSLHSSPTLHKSKYFKDIFLSLKILCKIKLQRKICFGILFLHESIPSFTIKIKLCRILVFHLMVPRDWSVPEGKSDQHLGDNWWSLFHSAGRRPRKQASSPGNFFFLPFSVHFQIDVNYSLGKSISWLSLQWSSSAFLYQWIYNAWKKRQEAFLTKI